jgi:hypothetical protein
VHLGAMEASERLSALTDQLHGKWADARRQFEEHLSAAASARDTVRAGLEKAFEDLREALLESKNRLA